jgi:hypothetical protein
MEFLRLKLFITRTLNTRLILKTGVEGDFFNPSYFPAPAFSLQKFNQLNAKVVD